MAVKMIETTEDVVHEILRRHGTIALGPFENEEEARGVGRELLPLTWGTFEIAPSENQRAEGGPSEDVVLLLSRTVMRDMEPVLRAVCRPEWTLHPGTKVYSLTDLDRACTEFREEGAAPQHPRIGEEYLTVAKGSCAVDPHPRRVIAFDHEESTGKTYVWCYQQGGRLTCVLQERDWIPAHGNEAILAKAMGAAQLSKNQRDIMLAAFNEMKLIDGDTGGKTV